MKSSVSAAARLFLLVVILAAPGTAQQKPQEKNQDMASCPMHAQQKPSTADQRNEGVVQRGDQVMGFAHEKTTHHFRLYADGGAIEVAANQAADTTSRDEIRSHLGHIVTMFADGNFSAPMLIHAENPPGTETMKRLRDAIQYKLVTTEKGASIRIATKNADALRAVHEFLRFQISDHQTGDPPEVTKAP
jgi:hypothetical protein